MKKIKKIILHIGSEKTGTTTIQKFMASNRKSLIENRILFPFTPGQENHVSLAIYAANIDKKLGRFLQIYEKDALDIFRSRFDRDLTKEILSSDADFLFLSAEWLHPRVSEADEFERLADLLHRFSDDIRILFYVRRQDEMLVSRYSTELRAGGTREFSFPDVKATALPYYLDYSEIANRWGNFFGANSVIVRRFDKIRFFNDHLIHDFLQASDVPWKDVYLLPITCSNQAINVTGQELVRSLNIISGKNNELTVQLKRIALNRIEAEYAGRGIAATREDAMLFYSTFAKSNELLKSRYFAHSEELFNDDFSSYPDSAPFIDRSQIKDKLAEILQELDIQAFY